MIIELEEQLLEAIDNTVETASDDELFAGGYLRGHISLAAADCELEGIQDIAVFKQRTQASLDAARNELTPADQLIVATLWQRLNQAV
ncbi:MULTISPECIES: YfcL family protein [Vibrio]|uniref:YfcL family protein n=1 Tax=Vibrio algicola TaxID=2662262 RepID=A0A5Q0TF89_9VIBR|nr:MULTISPECIES: YfcL family protein [Vibrio]MBD1574947.1 YfcL family protein [Vibrio sp. S11_S32]